MSHGPTCRCSISDRKYTLCELTQVMKVQQESIRMLRVEIEEDILPGTLHGSYQKMIVKILRKIEEINE